MAGNSVLESTNWGGIVNPYVINTPDLSNYTLFRGVTDFTQIGQFNQFETGYSFLQIVEMPKFITALGEKNSMVKIMADNFQKVVEYEFRGLSGIPDVQGETFTITDGINEQNIINKVTADTSIEVSMSYFEKTGSLLTRFAEYYLTGIKDRMSQAKHYHGLIKNDLMDPSYRNEVFTMMYFVTDNTMLRIEKAYLLCNAQLNKAETSMYDSSKGEYSNKEVTLTFNCFPIWGKAVDKAAYILLRDITGSYVTQDSVGTPTFKTEDTYYNARTADLDSNDYLYGIMNDGTHTEGEYAVYSNKGTEGTTAGAGLAGQSTLNLNYNQTLADAFNEANNLGYDDWSTNSSV